MVVRSSYIPAGLLQFIIDEMVEETTALRALRVETANLPNAESQIPPEQGAVFKVSSTIDRCPLNTQNWHFHWLRQPMHGPSDG